MNKVSLLLIGIVVSFVLFSCEEEPVLPEEDDEIETPLVASEYDDEIFDLINEYRMENNLDTLIFDENIWIYAHEHSTNMSTGTTDFGHDGFNERASALYGIIGGNRAAENVAYNHSTNPQDVVTQWINSEGHRKNMVGNYTHAAVSAVKREDGRYYYTQIFMGIN